MSERASRAPNHLKGQTSPYLLQHLHNPVDWYPWCEEALQKAAGFAPDLILIDVMMPGLDGPSWVSIARQKRPDVGVVFVSGYAEDAFGEGKDEIPNSVFLPKPFTLSDLTQRVKDQIEATGK